MQIKIAVILAGCGKNDGSEIHESVLTLLSIVQNGASYQCFSLNKNQHHVTNHVTNSIDLSENRNMLVESARIARCDIKDLEGLNVDDYDALIIPGGNGVAYNLFNLAYVSENFVVEETIVRVCKEFTKHNKPIGFICIAPAMIPIIYGDKVSFTIGDDEKIEKSLENIGATHKKSIVSDVVIDKKTKIFSTPAYMLATDINQVYISIKNLVDQVIYEIKH